MSDSGDIVVTASKAHVSFRCWEGDAYIVTVNDQPLGLTMTEIEAKKTANWLQSCVHEVVTVLAGGKVFPI